MTGLLALCVAVIFAVSIYLMLGRELKEVAMGVFLLSHAANLGILMMSGQPLFGARGHMELKGPPMVGVANPAVDPLPQALILTSIVISFAVMAFLLTLLVVTHRRTEHLDVNILAAQDRPDFDEDF